MAGYGYGGAGNPRDQITRALMQITAPPPQTRLPTPPPVPPLASPPTPGAPGGITSPGMPTPMGAPQLPTMPMPGAPQGPAPQGLPGQQPPYPPQY